MTQLEDLKQVVEKLSEDHRDTTRTTNIMATTVSKLDRELFGNGRPGLVEKMSEVQVTQKMMLKVTWLVGGGIMAAATGILLTLL